MPSACVQSYFGSLRLNRYGGLVAKTWPTLCDSMDCCPPGSSVHGNFPGKNTGVVAISFSRGSSPNLGSEPGSPALQADSLSTESFGKLSIHLLNDTTFLAV